MKYRVTDSTKVITTARGEILVRRDKNFTGDIISFETLDGFEALREREDDSENYDLVKVPAGTRFSRRKGEDASDPEYFDSEHSGIDYVIWWDSDDDILKEFHEGKITNLVWRD